MALENPTYVSDFDEASPVGNLDFIAEGDDHIRRMKAAIKRTLPGMNHRAWAKRSVSVGGSITLGDNMSMIRATQNLTLVPDAASVLGNGWMAYIRADGGTVTIDPAQNINGAGSVDVPNGYTGVLFSDGTEFFMSLIFSSVPSTVKAFPSGTKMIFQQTTPPIGWTQQLSGVYNDAAIRLTTGTAGTGGADGFATTVFGSGKNTSGHSLTSSENGSHAHDSNADQVGGVSGVSGGNVIIYSRGQGSPFNTGSSGSGSAHTHPMPNLNMKYVDFIVASID